jgi:hypothetical protein
MSMPAMDDDRVSDAREDGAVFAPTTVRQARGPRVLAAVVVIALAGLVAIGALDRAWAPDTGSVAVSTGGPAATLAALSERSSRPPPRASRLPTTPQEHSERFATGPGETLPAGTIDAMSVDVRPAGSHLFIHGDVFSLDIVRVSVSLEDALGNVAAQKTIDVPGAGTAFRLGAVPRFDVHFFLPDEVRGDGFVISTTALDAHGKQIETLLQWVARSPVTM